MKQLALLLLLCSFSTVQAQSDSTAIHSVIERFFDGLSNTDDNQVKSEVTAGFELLEDGELWTLDTLLVKMAPMKGRGVQRVNQFHFITTEQKGAMAWVSYENTAFFTLGERKQTVRWLESAVLVKEKGKWKIRMLHSTKLK